jgi:hypothetical protein
MIQQFGELFPHQNILNLHRKHQLEARVIGIITNDYILLGIH